MTAAIGPDEVTARVKRLPALPRAVALLNEALDDPATPIDRVVQAVGADTGLASAALKLANSSFYGVRGRVASVRDAVQILGLRTLSDAVLTSAVMARFPRAACPRFDPEAAWRHALATALCARQLAQARGLDGCLAYTAGLLHDIGRLALASHFPAAYDEVLAHTATHDAVPEEAERRVLGIDHAEVGAQVARHWQLAPTVIRAIEHHHAVPATEPCPIIDVVHVADAVVHALDLSGEPDAMVPPVSAEAWERLALPAPALQAVFAAVEARLRDLDLRHLC